MLELPDDPNLCRTVREIVLAEWPEIQDDDLNVVYGHANAGWDEVVFTDELYRIATDRLGLHHADIDRCRALARRLLDLWELTEEQWLATKDPAIIHSNRLCLSPHLMLRLVRKRQRLDKTKAGQRRLRLVGCGCIRRYWHHLSEQARTLVELAEKVADGRLTNQQRWDLQQRHRPVIGRLVVAADEVVPWLLEKQASVAAVMTQSDCYNVAAGRLDDLHREQFDQAVVIHDLFGNPFRPRARVPKTIRTTRVVALASEVYEGRTFDRLPELAVVLENDGCNNAELLSHLRSRRPHWRGCWALDAVLGKR